MRQKNRISVNNPNRDALERAIAVAGGQSHLAKAIGTKQSTIWSWLTRSKKGPSGEACRLIEAATGIPRHELRPDIFDAPLNAEAA